MKWNWIIKKEENIRHALKWKIDCEFQGQGKVVSGKQENHLHYFCFICYVLFHGANRMS